MFGADFDEKCIIMHFLVAEKDGKAGGFGGGEADA
jgi:hypothetical protein